MTFRNHMGHGTIHFVEFHVLRKDAHPTSYAHLLHISSNLQVLRQRHPPKGQQRQRRIFCGSLVSHVLAPATLAPHKTEQGRRRLVALHFMHEQSCAQQGSVNCLLSQADGVGRGSKAGLLVLAPALFSLVSSFRSIHSILHPDHWFCYPVS